MCDDGARLRVLLATDDGAEEVVFEADMAELLPDLASGNLALFDSTGKRVEDPARVVALAIAERLQDALELRSHGVVRVEVRRRDGSGDLLSG